MKKFLLLSVICLAVTTTASAADSQKASAKHGRYLAPVMTKDGACVRTKWNTVNDVCGQSKVATPAAPIPVAEPSFPQPALEQRTVYFDFNKSKLTPAGKLKLDNLGEVVRQHKQVKRLSVIGYTDEIGKEKYNLTLSQKRASAVASYLQDKVTVPVDILEVRGLGETNIQTSCPASMKRTQRINCAFKDRRVEVELVLGN